MTRPSNVPLDVDTDLTLDPAVVYGPLRITRSGVTVDGRGATIEPPPQTTLSRRNGRGQGEGPRIGVAAAGINSVTLRNLVVHGFETGLRIEAGAAWTIEGCDFSDNFHDPDFGWGDNGRRGGIVLQDVTDSVVRNNRANRVWDACALYGCAHLEIVENDFSHASNTCLKLWQSSNNLVQRNNLSHGIRISPGEVHARDSAGVLVEHASNDNRFLDNDATHGGDGFFIRLLDSLPSSGNYLEGNDASYANNNCFEAWAPNITYVRNRANYGSHGFWLGGSTNTILLDNEAAFNGAAASRNAPEPGLGHCGIVFANAPSSNGVLRRNSCHHNAGAGIAIRGHNGQPAANWLLESNRLERNSAELFLDDVVAMRISSSNTEIY